MLEKRNIPKEDGFGILYSAVENADNTVIVDHRQGDDSMGLPSSESIVFDSKDHNLLVAGLVGCTSVVVVSHQRAWASHLWEVPAFSRTQVEFQAGVLNALQPLGALFGGDTGNTKIYIMTPAMRPSEIGDPGDPKKGDYIAQYDNKIEQIITYLGGILPGVPVGTFIYPRQGGYRWVGTDVYGKLMVITSAVSHP
jgi:hypothetical protein